ncbi:retrovirus-related Pol polyprotein from transposon 17.6 [Trichonephila clavipes]|uniref:RNA-directed DNA polymerase n=1 Tax=Trichonephila clavipes TaxID=2585209 RepID=A0A8X7BN18_TRICX|nr:retrovirus-related Pol polyprotein from transposon 17.6 [Trichonephila clavipes]
MRPPKNNREVSKFLGMTGWYQKFIPRYADICEPLYQLKKKGAKFNWSGEAQDSFDQIKRTLTEALVLQLLNFSEQFNLFTDASGVGIGAVLQQNQKPIAFASRTLNKAERNYTVTERKCLAVIWDLNKFKTYFGALSVKVITDHAALTKLTNGKNLSSRMIRWALKLSEFNIEWQHRPGVQNVVADLLSRNPVDSIEGLQISCAALRALAINSREQFVREQREDPELGHIYRYFENPDDGSVNATVCEEDTKYVGRNIERLFDEARRNMRKKHKSWEKYYNRRRRDVHIKVNDLVLIQTHFLSAAGRKQVGKFMPKFEGPYRVLEVKGRDHCKGLSTRTGKDSLLSKGRESRGRFHPRSHPELNKFKIPNTSSQGVESIAGPSRLPDCRLNKSTTVESRTEGSGRDNKTRQTRATTIRRNKQAERPIRLNQATTRRPCSYYLRSRVKESDRIPEEQRNSKSTASLTAE